MSRRDDDQELTRRLVNNGQPNLGLVNNEKDLLTTGFILYFWRNYLLHVDVYSKRYDMQKKI